MPALTARSRRPQPTALSNSRASTSHRRLTNRRPRPRSTRRRLSGFHTGLGVNEWLADRRARQTKRAEPTALATEIVCILRYKYHAVAATGIASKSAADEFTEHAEDEEKHAKWISERINQLGGKPNFNPAELTARSATEYVEGENLVDMIRENLVAERIAIEHYRDLIRFFADKDPTSRHMMELILTDEEEHANDMHDLLVAHEGLPMLAR